MQFIEQEFDYGTTTALVALHVGFVCAIIYGYCFGFYTISWILAGIFIVGAGYGVTIAYHRMLTHKSFVCSNRTVRRVLIYFGGLLQRTKSWVANHWSHHAYTDTILDPHSPYVPYRGGIKGWWHSHLEWLFWKYIPPDKWLNHPDLKDPDIVWEDRWHIVFVISGFFLPALIAGSYGILTVGSHAFFWYGIDAFFLSVIRTVIMLHVTCSINSFGHMVGWKAREPNDRHFTSDSSRNNPPLALISFGEGNHGDHHLYPGSARIGWLDPSWPIILFFEKLRIFRDVKRPSLTH